MLLKFLFFIFHFTRIEDCTRTNVQWIAVNTANILNSNIRRNRRRLITEYFAPNVRMIHGHAISCGGVVMVYSESKHLCEEFITLYKELYGVAESNFARFYGSRKMNNNEVELNLTKNKIMEQISLLELLYSIKAFIFRLVSG